MIGSVNIDSQINVGSGIVYGSLYHWDPVTRSYIARPLNDIRSGGGIGCWRLATSPFLWSPNHLHHNAQRSRMRRNNKIRS